MISAQEITTIYLIRHAEKADASKDTELSEAGKARAEKWKDYFLDKNIEAIYSTNYKRTLNTVKPFAKHINLNIEIYGSQEMDLDALAKTSKYKTLLIVGHSNRLPKYINTLIGNDTYPDINEEEFGTLYTIIIDGDNVSHRMEKL